MLKHIQEINNHRKLLSNQKKVEDEDESKHTIR